MEIIKSNKSRILKVDFSNLTFGEEFTDHMFTCDYIDGKWINPKIIPYEKLKMDPSSSVLHYGQSVFEGMKAYKDSILLLFSISSSPFLPFSASKILYDLFSSSKIFFRTLLIGSSSSIIKILII